MFEIDIYRIALLIDKQRRKLTKRQPFARGFSTPAYKISSFHAGLCVAQNSESWHERAVLVMKSGRGKATLCKNCLPSGRLHERDETIREVWLACVGDNRDRIGYRRRR